MVLLSLRTLTSCVLLTTSVTPAMVSVATRVECANAVDCGQKLLQNVGQQMVSKFKSWSIVYPLMLTDNYVE